jgi:hypothetical protein
MAFSPIVTPGITVECEPIRQLRFSTTGAALLSIVETE